MQTIDLSLLDNYVEDLKKSDFFKDKNTPESFEYMMAYYRRQTKRRRKWFRIAGLLLILLSSLLPVLAAFGSRLFRTPENKDIVISALAAIIAILSSLNAFFRWDVGWRGQTEALFALQRVKAEWDARLAEARTLSDPEKAITIVRIATDQMIASSYEIVKAEMGEYFKVQKPPETKPSQ